MGIWVVITDPIIKITKRDPSSREPLSPIKILAGDQLKTRKPKLMLDKIHKQTAKVFSSLRKKKRPATREKIALLVLTKPSAPSIKLNVLINQIEPNKNRKIAKTYN
jgi:hypothetical protein